MGKEYRWIYKVTSYNGADRLPVDVTIFQSQDQRRFMRSFVEEFHPKMTAPKFEDVLVKFVCEHDTGVFETTAGDLFSAKLEWKEVEV